MCLPIKINALPNARWRGTNRHPEAQHDNDDAIQPPPVGASHIYAPPGDTKYSRFDIGAPLVVWVSFYYV